MLLSFALLLLATLGCSNGNPKTYEVRGIVHFPDGVPLNSGTIEFESLGNEKSVRAFSEIAADGTFELGTFSIDDGAIEGRHRAIVVSKYEIGTGAERPDQLEPSKLHPRFADYSTSGLEFEVQPGHNEITVPVEYAPRGRR
jgi:hypothetical protein